jgi:hypothetical protein
MNRFYGVRFRQSFQSESAWREINAFGGKALMAASVPVLIAGIHGMIRPEGHGPLTGAGVLLASLAVATAASFLKARQHAGGNERR